MAWRSERASLTDPDVRIREPIVPAARPPTDDDIGKLRWVASSSRSGPSQGRGYWVIPDSRRSPELQTRDDSTADHQALPIWSIRAGSAHHEDGSVRPPHHCSGHGRVEEPGEESLVMASDDLMATALHLLGRSTTAATRFPLTSIPQKRQRSLADLKASPG